MFLIVTIFTVIYLGIRYTIYNTSQQITSATPLNFIGEFEYGIPGQTPSLLFLLSQLMADSLLVSPVFNSISNVDYRPSSIVATFCMP